MTDSEQQAMNGEWLDDGRFGAGFGVSEPDAEKATVIQAVRDAGGDVFAEWDALVALPDVL